MEAGTVELYNSVGQETFWQAGGQSSDGSCNWKREDWVLLKPDTTKKQSRACWKLPGLIWPYHCFLGFGDKMEVLV